MMFNFRLFTLHTAASLAERFRHRIVEWQLAAAMAVSGLILLRPGDTFDLPPYAAMAGIANEDTWGFIFLLTGLVRIGALAVNGALPTGTALARAALSFLCAFFWAVLLLGHMAMSVPTVASGLLAGAFVTEFVSIYRAAGDTRTASKENGGGNGSSV